MENVFNNNNFLCFTSVFIFGKECNVSGKQTHEIIILIKMKTESIFIRMSKCSEWKVVLFRLDRAPFATSTSHFINHIAYARHQTNPLFYFPWFMNIWSLLGFTVSIWMWISRSLFVCLEMRTASNFLSTFSSFSVYHPKVETKSEFIPTQSKCVSVSVIVSKSIE